eukprot:TRINITY_DN49720_c0_g1_i1.p1 TRINITY_DN49720_c0_g1~~TRINITY_DN49720_c0_g1_i1.p1  ORF type:complete len:331 (+),score=32.13 TRINITY_DN49720_c0_g1_i1:105-1097(+)
MASALPSAFVVGIVFSVVIGVSEGMTTRQNRTLPYDLRVQLKIAQSRQLREGPVSLQKCLAPGKLKFVHVMKSGGISVDAYLWCRCEHEVCSVSHHEGARAIGGVKSCEEPSVCTSHLPAFQQWHHCGPFMNAKTFTVLRDPVSRVLSFYNYMRFARPEDNYPGYLPYQNNNLTYILKSWGITDVDIGQPKETERGGCVVCAAQMSNAMVLRHFATRASMAAQQNWNMTAGVLAPPSDQAMYFQLSEAKRTLTRMDAIFVDMKSFKDAFERNDLLSAAGGPTYSSCEVPVANPTATKVEATEEDIHLIKKLNWADIELYSFALTLPHFRG